MTADGQSSQRGVSSSARGSLNLEGGTPLEVKASGGGAPRRKGVAPLPLLYSPEGNRAQRTKRRRTHLSLGFEWPEQNHDPNARALREAWSGYIDASGPWDWFTTHTFKQDVSPALALRWFDVWHARLTEACRQKARRHAHARAAVAIEWTYRDRVHLHAVLRARGMQAFSRQRWQHRWEGVASRWCGMARVFPANDGRASSYLAKYLGKGGFLVLRGAWPVTRNPRSEVTSKFASLD